jgi:hypothetical protein
MELCEIGGKVCKVTDTISVRIGEEWLTNNSMWLGSVFCKMKSQNLYRVQLLVLRHEIDKLKTPEMRPCSLVECYQRLGGICYLHLQGIRNFVF